MSKLQRAALAEAARRAALVYCYREKPHGDPRYATAEFDRRVVSGWRDIIALNAAAERLTLAQAAPSFAGPRGVYVRRHFSADSARLDYDLACRHPRTLWRLAVPSLVLVAPWNRYAVLMPTREGAALYPALVALPRRDRGYLGPGCAFAAFCADKAQPVLVGRSSDPEWAAPVRLWYPAVTA